MESIMIGGLNAISTEMAQAIVRIITGRLFSKKQISTITSNTIGK
jgi:hypothetical protein